MNRVFLGVVCGVAAVALLLIPTGSDPQPPLPDDTVKASPEVNQAFDTYKRLWLKHNLDAASKLDSGELKTDREVHEFIALGQEPIRKVAFESIAKKEQEVLGEGKWTPQAHSTLLKGYSSVPQSD